MVTLTLTLTLSLASSAADGPGRIDAFIERALAWYKKELLKLRDDCRYMYTMVSTSGAGALLGAGFATKPKGGGDEASTGFKYKRYTLSDSNPKPTPTPTPTPKPNPNLIGTSSPTTRRSSRSSSERRTPS